MPVDKRALQPPARADNKPVAPTDLWERLNKEVAALQGQPIGLRPPDSFTVEEYAAACQRSKDWAHDKLTVLFKRGILKRVKVGYAYCYYFASK